MVPPLVPVLLGSSVAESCAGHALQRRSAPSWVCCGSEAWQEPSGKGRVPPGTLEMAVRGVWPSSVLTIEGHSSLKCPLSRLPDICSSDKLQSTSQGREQNWPAFIDHCFRPSLEVILFTSWSVLCKHSSVRFGLKKRRQCAISVVPHFV